MAERIDHLSPTGARDSLWLSTNRFALTGVPTAQPDLAQLAVEMGAFEPVRLASPATPPAAIS
jgi:hypothetical protein